MLPPSPQVLRFIIQTLHSSVFEDSYNKARETNYDENRVNIAIKESEIDKLFLKNSGAGAKNFIPARNSCRDQFIDTKLKPTPTSEN